MPHWDGIIETSSPRILEACNGKPLAVREQIMALTPEGVSVRAISWEAGKDVARVRVEGPNAKAFLDKLEARDVVQLVNAHEREAEKDGG
ncbi:MAG: hypothetical protein E6G50_09215 [Actinobacteria bacterium]|jgi:hypothetical protein|nr:MAG: hypothetical protein E6G50_09215 [Actinomycetota bacterium]